MRSDTLDGIRDDNDGGDSRYSAAVGGGRHRFAVGDILDITLEFVLHSSLSTSARVLVCGAGYNISALDTFDVPPVDPLLHHQSQRRHLGYARSSGQENEEGQCSYILCYVCFPCFNGGLDKNYKIVCLGTRAREERSRGSEEKSQAEVSAWFPAKRRW